jgi:hypothetical protein
MEPNITPKIESTVKFTDEEIASINSIKDRYQTNVLNFGQLYLQRKDLEEIEQSLLTEKKNIENAEKTFLDGIVSKYGEGTFDQKTGIFTPKAKK